MWYLVSWRWTAAPDDIRSMLQEHLSWNEEHHRSGRLLFSGPSPGNARGFMVFRGNDADEDDIRAICATEPFTAKGHREFDIAAWDVRHVLGTGPFTVEGIEASGLPIPPARSSSP